LFACVQVDLRIGFAGWWVEGGGSAVDVLVGEVVIDTGLLERGHNTRFGRGADDRHGISSFVQLLQLLGDTRAWSSLCGQLRDDLAEFTADVVLHLIWSHLEVVLLLETHQHSAEVLTDKVFEEGVDTVAFLDAMFLEKLVGEIGASFEGETLGEDEGVVAVEEDVFDLCKGLS